jgi:peptide/nickel transport system substrate-binding protein
MQNRTLPSVSRGMKVSLVGVFVLLTVLAVGCSEDPTPTPVQAQPTATSAPAATPTPAFPSAQSEEQYGLWPEDGIPQYGGMIRLHDEVFTSLTMHDNAPSNHKNIGSQMHDNLFALDWTSGRYAYDGSVEKRLVEDWSLSADGLVYTFNLRPGVKFHDGTDFDAADVKATFDFLMDPGDYAPPGKSYIAPYVSSTEVVDPLTVKVTLGAPSPIFLNQIAVTWAPIFSSDDLAKGNDWFLNNNNGTGPFVFDQSAWQRDVSMTFLKNENYWEEGIPFLDSQQLVALAPAAALAAFETKNIDFLVNIASPKQADDMKSRFGDEVQVVKKPGLGHSYVLLNTRKPPFDDPQVRRAVYLWLDRQDVIDRAYDGAGFLGEWISPVVHSGFGTPIAELQKTNLAFSDRDAARAEAKKVLADAGVDPTQISITVLARYTSGNSLAANQVVTAQLRDLGFDAKLDSRDRTVGVKMLKEGTEWEAAFYAGASPLMVPDGTLNRYVGPSGQRNYTGNSDSVLEPLIEELNTTVDVSERARIIASIDEYLQQGTYPMIPILWTQDTLVFWDWIKAKKQMGNMEDVEDHTWIGAGSPGR